MLGSESLLTDFDLVGEPGVLDHRLQRRLDKWAFGLAQTTSEARCALWGHALTSVFDHPKMLARDAEALSKLSPVQPRLSAHGIEKLPKNR